MIERCKLTAVVVLVFACAGGAAETPDPTATAKAILKATGARGGLIVAASCGDPELLCALAKEGPFVVQGLSTDADAVSAGRKTILAAGMAGKVSMIEYDGRRLPYVDASVNLLLIHVGSSAPQPTWPGPYQNELHRVLAPGGSSWLLSAERRLEGGKVIKPRPTDTDEWTHFLHDSGGNAVAKDRQVSPPNSLRWVAGPRWCRSHEVPSSVKAMVTTGGRIFTILDEAPPGVYVNLPEACKLVARDACNGVLLWKVPLRGWQPRFGTGVGDRWKIHHTIPRRLVAQGDRVYVTLGFLNSPVSVLDAATGKVITEALPGTRGADELILDDGVLIAKLTSKRSLGAEDRFAKAKLDDTLVAVDVKTGRQLWRKPAVRVLPYALSALDGRVVYHNMDELVCLDARTGKRLWAAGSVIKTAVGGANTLVIADGVVLYHGPAVAKAPPKGKAPRRGGSKLFAYSLTDGEPLWQAKGQRSLAAACTQPTDVFVAGGTVWYGQSLEGLDLRTGKVRATRQIGELISPGHHYRCHRGKATERFLIWPKRGAEFIDLSGENHMRNDWLRGPCFTGMTPANGMLYVPPSQCFCYPGVKVSGFLGLVGGDREQASAKWKAAMRTPRNLLTKGPAYGSNTSGVALLASDWPMHRRDGKRSGSTPATVPDKPAKLWEARLASPGSQAVVVGDKLWVAEKDAHRVRCLSVADGSDVWSFTAGGRIDSAPTFHEGRVIFGCRDGSVYCLRAADGELAWRFRAAPNSHQVVSFGQLESLWPVHGSVLVQDGVAYFAAGRSSFLDGGIMVFGLDAKTGEVRCRHHLEGPWPDVMTETGRPFAMEGALPDVIVSDGKDLYMRRIKFDAGLKRLETPRESSLGELDMGAAHIAATGGLLDDTGFDRLYWMHSRRWPGFYFAQQAPKAGQLVVFDESTTYAVKYFYRRIKYTPAFFPAEKGYLLFADDIDNEPLLEERGKPKQAIDWLPAEAATDKHRRGGRGVEKGTGYVRGKPAKWQTMIPLRVRAMVLAGGHLCAAGLPDVVDEKDPWASFEGRKGAMLNVYSTADGSLVSSLRLDSPPAFDALSAAAGRLYLATADGRLMCFGAKAAR